MPLLRVPRGRKPLSLWDWKIWSQARPTLWRYGDACNLYPHRETDLLTVEWMDALMQREEMVYTLPSDSEHVSERQRQNQRQDDGDGELNRFRGDWLALHLFATLYQLSEHRQSTFHFLNNGDTHGLSAYVTGAQKLSPPRLV